MGNNGLNVIAIVFKVMGFIIALAGLIYKVYFAILYFDKISMWWNGSMIAMYFLFYITSLATMASSFFKGKVGMIIAISIIFTSVSLLVVDGLAVLGFAASLDSASLIERGIVPLVNVLNMLAGIINLLASILQNRQSKPQY